MAADALVVAIDAAVRLAIVALGAEWVTRRRGRAAPALANAAWRLVLGCALILPGAVWFVPAVAFVRPEPATLAALSAAVPAAAIDALALVYLAGATIAAAPLCAGLVAIRRLRRSARVIRGSELRRVRELAAVAGFSSSAVSFLELESLGVPGTIGCLRSRVLLPSAWRTWPDERLSAVLGHELAHVERRDYAAGLVAAVVRVLWWWHPVAALLARRLSLTAEMACDAGASRRRGSVEYAEDLLQIAAEVGSRSVHPAWLPGATSNLSARIDALLARLDASPRAAPRTAIAPAAAALLVVCTTLPLRIDPIAPAVAAGTSGDLHGHAATHALRHSAH